jgi:hypothetical protein
MPSNAQRSFMSPFTPMQVALDAQRRACVGGRQQHAALQLQHERSHHSRQHRVGAHVRQFKRAHLAHRHIDAARRRAPHRQADAQHARHRVRGVDAVLVQVHVDQRFETVGKSLSSPSLDRRRLRKRSSMSLMVQLLLLLSSLLKSFELSSSCTSSLFAGGSGCTGCCCCCCRRCCCCRAAQIALF